MNPKSKYDAVVEITEADLPLCCPMPHEDVRHSHPRVYLTLDADGVAVCPYCSTVYRLKKQNDDA